MTTYYDALQSARRLRGFFDACTETRNAWIFHSVEERHDINPSSAVVIKESGECMDYGRYVMTDTGRSDERLRTFRVC